VKEVEVFEIARKTWKTINYISEPERLLVLSPGAMQIAGSQILIFGGFIPKSTQRNTEKNFEFTDNGVNLVLTNQSLIFDVTVGFIKFGPELVTPTYFISGGYMMTTN